MSREMRTPIEIMRDQLKDLQRKKSDADKYSLEIEKLKEEIEILKSTHKAVLRQIADEINLKTNEVSVDKIITHLIHEKRKRICEDWLDDISNGNTANVILEMKKHFNSDELDNTLSEIIALSSRYSLLEEKLRKGIISNQDYNLQFNLVNSSLIELIFKIKKPPSH